MSFVKYVNNGYFDSYTLEDGVQYCMKGCYKNLYVSFGANSYNIQSVISSMENVKRGFNNNSGKQMHHFVISIHPYKRMEKDRKIRYATLILYDIGNYFLRKGFQSIGVIHVNQDVNVFNKGILDYEENVHIHFLVNSVSFFDGRKLHNVYKIKNELIHNLKQEYGQLNWQN